MFDDDDDVDNYISLEDINLIELKQPRILTYTFKIFLELIKCRGVYSKNIYVYYYVYLIYIAIEHHTQLINELYVFIFSSAV